MEIHTLTHTHIPQILELESHSAPEKPYYSKYDTEALEFLFNNPKNAGAIGLFDNDRLIGWGAYRTNCKRHTKEVGTCEVSSVVIDKKFRRQGLGAKVLEKVIEIIQSNGEAQSIFLTVSPLNTGALLLYLKRGFVIYDFRKDVYGPGSDRVYLKLDL